MDIIRSLAHCRDSRRTKTVLNRKENYIWDRNVKKTARIDLNQSRPIEDWWKIIKIKFISNPKIRLEMADYDYNTCIPEIYELLSIINYKGILPGF